VFSWVLENMKKNFSLITALRERNILIYFVCVFEVKKCLQHEVTHCSFITACNWELDKKIQVVDY
jgi:hypothetical protein